jgi:hypothetical protein
MATGDNAAAAVYFSDTDAGTSNRDQGLNLHRPRERYKEKKRERDKDISRQVPDEKGRANLLSASDGKETSSPSPEGVEAQWSEHGDQVAEQLRAGEGQLGLGRTMAAETSSRVYSGISVQQDRNDGRVKLYITLQRPADRVLGSGLKITGELKKRDRWREIQTYTHDEVYFQEFVREAKQAFRQREGQWVMGRCHARGRRDSWIPNCLVVGRLEGPVVQDVRIWIRDEVYEFALDGAMSPSQQASYYCMGIWGELARSRPVLDIDDMPREKI